MIQKEQQAAKLIDKKQLAKIQKKIKWLYRYDPRKQDSIYVQQKIFFGKKTLEFLDKFAQNETIRP